MTKDEVYQKYLEWHKGKLPMSYVELFQSAAANVDVFENENTVINHLYYLVVERCENNSKYFIFYENNLFSKSGDDEFNLVKSECFIPNK